MDEKSISLGGLNRYYQAHSLCACFTNTMRLYVQGVMCRKLEQWRASFGGEWSRRHRGQKSTNTLAYRLPDRQWVTCANDPVRVDKLPTGT